MRLATLICMLFLCGCQTTTQEKPDPDSESTTEEVWELLQDPAVIKAIEVYHE